MTDREFRDLVRRMRLAQRALPGYVRQLAQHTRGERHDKLKSDHRAQQREADRLAALVDGDLARDGA